jgi:hypothetical protein
MINYFVRRQHTYTMERFLAQVAQDISGSVTVIPYERLLGSVTLDAGPCIFADVDVLGPRLRMLASALHSELAGRTDVLLMNDPLRSLGKYSLLRLLHEQGINSHNVYRFDDVEKVTFPVFLRFVDDHNGPRSPLLHTRTELRKALHRSMRMGKAGRIIVTEFTDVSDEEGIFRKYAAFKVGERIIPRHMFAGRDWVQKEPKNALLDKRFVEEEASYVRENRHEHFLKEIFDSAAIAYGRIDYGMLNGRPQIWEINTNPMILTRRYLEVKERSATQQFFLERMCRALQALDTRLEGRVRFTPDWGLRLRSTLAGIPAIKRFLSPESVL